MDPSQCPTEAPARTTGAFRDATGGKRPLDRVIALAPVEQQDPELTYTSVGIAYQTDRENTVPYDAAYWDKYVLYDGTPLSDALNEARRATCEFHEAGLHHHRVCDVGIGCGSFLSHMADHGWDVLGMDVNPRAQTWLHTRGWDHDLARQEVNAKIGIWTFWDVLEHIPDPTPFWNVMPKGTQVAISMPIYPTLGDVKRSKHYRPDEHYLYFTDEGLIWYMRQHGFAHLWHHTQETAAGREDIGTHLFTLQ